MNGATLPGELVELLKESISCRDSQIKQLSLLLGSPACRLQTLVVHGVAATGKSLTINAILSHLKSPSAIVRSKECITTRHLLERTISSVRDALPVHPGSTPLPEIDSRCENLAAFVTTLQRLLEDRDRFILVFDNIDRQREAAPTLLPALCRLGEIIPNLTTLLILTTPLQTLSHASLPHIHFPPYTRDETLSILTNPPASNFPLGSLSHNALTSKGEPPLYTYSAADESWLWSRYIVHIWDSLGHGAARDIVSFRRVCERLWKPFVQPIVDGEYGVRGSQELAKLLVRQRGLLQSEAVLVPSIVPITPTVAAGARPAAKSKGPPLPYIPSTLLISAYLASTTPPKNDITLFSLTTTRSRRKRGGGTALTPRKQSSMKNQGIHNRKRLLGHQAWPLERMLAIFHSVTEGGVRSGSADVLTQFRTLVSLRLIVRAGTGEGDVLSEGGGKWRCAVGEEFVANVARGAGVDLGEYVLE